MAEEATDEPEASVFEAKTALIFGFFCIGTQIFMAYNAGATNGSTDIIQKEDDWSEAALGILGGMDKFGMTLSSPFWGYMLQFYEAKLLVSCGLALNAGFTLVFAFSRNHAFMLTAKFMMGLTEGLQWVWSQIWITARAGGYPLFLNLNGVSAGAGTVVGTAVSGFSTAHGLSYGFAFMVEGFVLVSLWACLVLFPSTKSMAIMDHKDLVSSSSGIKKPLKVVLKSLWNHKVYINTAFVFAFDNFVILGLQFLWIRLFRSIWEVHKDHATTSLLLVPILGSAAGAAVGSAWPFVTDEQAVGTLKKCVAAALAAVIGAVIAVVGCTVETYRFLPLPWGATLSLAYAGIFLVQAGLTAEMGAVVGICTDCIKDKSDRSISVGLQQGCMNFFGLTLAPIIPQTVMAKFQPIFGISDNLIEDEIAPPELLHVGICTTLFGTVIVFMHCFFAWRAAQAKVEDSTEMAKPLTS